MPLILICILMFMWHTAAAITIMLDPAGDARTVGRTINDYFERSITFSFAKQLKQEIENKSRKIEVLLTRMPGYTVEPLQNQNFANRMGVDLYISIHFFQLPTHASNESYLYYLLYDPVIDFWKSDQSLFQFIPYQQVHRTHLQNTIKLAEQFCACFREKSSVARGLQGPHGIPFKPLIGLNCPALAIEIGLHKQEDTSLYLKAGAHAISCIAENL